jgi:hypothetical protein
MLRRRVALGGRATQLRDARQCSGSELARRTRWARCISCTSSNGGIRPAAPSEDSSSPAKRSTRHSHGRPFYSVVRRTLVVTLACLSGVACGGSEEAVRTVTATVGASPAMTETGASAAATGQSGKDRRHELRFRGNGDRRLPPFRVEDGGGVLRWTNKGEVLSLFGREGTLVDSVDSQGEAFLKAGVHRIDVVASGAWIMTISGASRAQ